MSEQWYIGVEGTSSGPFDRTTVEQMRQDGQVTADTLVWREGMEGWVRYAEGGLRAPLPPPLPSSETAPREDTSPPSPVGAPSEGTKGELGGRSGDPNSVSETEPAEPSAPSAASEGTKTSTVDERGLSMRAHLIILAIVAFGLAFLCNSYAFGHAGIPETLGATVGLLLFAGPIAWYKGPIAGYVTLAVISGLLIYGGRSSNRLVPSRVNNEAASTLGWTPFVSESEGWMVMFPEEPEVMRGSMERGRVKTYQATEFFEDGAILYSISVATRENGAGPLQGAMPAPDYLRRELQGSLLFFEEENLEVEDFDFTDGYPAVRYTYHFTEDGERLRNQGMWILVSDRLFKVSAFYHVAIESTGAVRYRTLADSFAILDLGSGS